jgi:hypothetical protein
MFQVPKDCMFDACSGSGIPSSHFHDPDHANIRSSADAEFLVKEITSNHDAQERSLAQAASPVLW